MMSTGLLTTISRPRNPDSRLAIPRTIAALSRSRSRRLSSGLPPRPAVITTASRSRMSSTAAACTVAAG
jgi:hypothetical protein